MSEQGKYIGDNLLNVQTTYVHRLLSLRIQKVNTKIVAFNNALKCHCAQEHVVFMNVEFWKDNLEQDFDSTHSQYGVKDFNKSMHGCCDPFIILKSLGWKKIVILKSLGWKKIEG